jgi:hypothetical protein
MADGTMSTQVNMCQRAETERIDSAHRNPYRRLAEARETPTSRTVRDLSAGSDLASIFWEPIS